MFTLSSINSILMFCLSLKPKVQYCFLPLSPSPKVHFVFLFIFFVFSLPLPKFIFLSFSLQKFSHFDVLSKKLFVMSSHSLLLGQFRIFFPSLPMSLLMFSLFKVMSEFPLSLCLSPALSTIHFVFCMSRHLSLPFDL